MPSKTMFLFGAGAEICHRMPAGGRFALDVVSKAHDSTIRDRLGRDRDTYGVEPQNGRNQQSELATEYRKWLGAQLNRRNIEAPGKQELRTVFQSTIENNTQELVQIAQDIDAIIEQSGVHEYDLDDVNPIPLGIQARSVLRNYLAPINDSQWLPYVIGYATSLQPDNETAQLGWQVALMFVRLALAGGGATVAAELGHIQFQDAQVQQQVGAQLGQLFQVDLRALEPESIEVAADAAQKEFNRDIDAQDLGQLFRRILVNTVSRVVDYQHLVEHFTPAIYQPSSNWPRFVKAAFLLHRMRESIQRWYMDRAEQSPTGGSYYQDLKERFHDQQALLSTTNYTDLICDVTRKAHDEILWLNGHVDQWLEPYQNVVYTEVEENPPPAMIVPYILAQSVIKPMFTGHTLSEYRRFLDTIASADEVVIVGYGFGQTDSHINALLRSSLLASKNKRFTVLLHHSDPGIGREQGEQDDQTELARRAVLKRMRFFTDPGVECLRVGIVDDNRQVSGESWLDWVQRPA